MVLVRANTALDLVTLLRVLFCFLDGTSPESIVFITGHEFCCIKRGITSLKKDGDIKLTINIDTGLNLNDL